MLSLTAESTLRCSFASSSDLFLDYLPPHVDKNVENYISVTAITAESKQLQEAQELFELYQSDYLALQRCSEELLYLKSVWDMGACTG